MYFSPEERIARRVGKFKPKTMSKEFPINSNHVKEISVIREVKIVEQFDKKKLNDIARELAKEILKEILALIPQQQLKEISNNIDNLKPKGLDLQIPILPDKIKVERVAPDGLDNVKVQSQTTSSDIDNILAKLAGVL